MCGWKQGDMLLAGQESRDCFDFISDVGIHGIYLSLALGTVKIQTTRLIIYVLLKITSNLHFLSNSIAQRKTFFGLK